MKHIIGIVVEYNPFHNGHLYQINYIHEKYPSAPIVVIMSGNFLERGEPAIIDKWHRSRECLLNGVDLVMELPILAAVQPADRFAYYSIWSLSKLGVTDLFFGAEHAEYNFNLYANLLKNLNGDFNNYNESYARSYQRMVSVKTGQDISQPNDLLGLAYAKSILRLKLNIILHPIQRKDSNYHDDILNLNSTISSASSIRNAVLKDNNIKLVKNFVPDVTLSDLKNNILVSWDKLWPYLRYCLLSKDNLTLSNIYGVSEGIQYRMVNKAQYLSNSSGYIKWIKSVKNKRFTFTRLNRIATMILLNITKKEVNQFNNNLYLRVLGFNSKGRLVLHNAKKNMDVPIITNFNRRPKGLLDVDYRSGKIYQLVNGREQDLKHAPIIY